jgi:hypothetical protein
MENMFFALGIFSMFFDGYLYRRAIDIDGTPLSRGTAKLLLTVVISFQLAVMLLILSRILRNQ